MKVVLVYWRHSMKHRETFDNAHDAIETSYAWHDGGDGWCSHIETEDGAVLMTHNDLLEEWCKRD